MIETGLNKNLTKTLAVFRAALQWLFGRTLKDILFTATIILVFITTWIGVRYWGDRDSGDLPPWMIEGIHGTPTLLVIAAINMIGLAAWGILRRRTIPAKLCRVAAAAALLAVFIGGINYFHGVRVRWSTYLHQHDIYHYMLGPKYLPELGYLDLYVCTIQAAPDKFPDNIRVRNLTDYRNITVGDYKSGNVPMPDCREKFSEQRWEEFRQDINQFFTTNIRRDSTPRRFIRDNGYNGGPFHSFFAHYLSNMFEFNVANANRAAMIDVALVCIFIIAVSRTFGFRIGIFFALFVFTNPVDRWLINGGSFLRYMWLTALVFGFCAAYTRRWGQAGAWFTISTALNIFPGMFLLGYLAYHAWNCIGEPKNFISGIVERYRAATALKENFGVVNSSKNDNDCSAGQKREPVHSEPLITEPARRAISGCIIAGLCALVLSMAHTRGPANYIDYFEAMTPHGQRVKYGFVGYGLGLRYAAGYRGQHTGADVREGFSHSRRVRQLEEIRWLITGLGIAGLLLTLLITSRLDAVESAALVGFTGFFGLMSTTGYYFSCACVLVLFAHRKIFDSGGLFILLLLLVANFTGLLYISIPGMHMFVLFNTVMSMQWLVWIIAVIIFLGYRTGIFGQIADFLFASAPVSERYSSHDIAPAPDLPPSEP